MFTLKRKIHGFYDNCSIYLFTVLKPLRTYREFHFIMTKKRSENQKAKDHKGNLLHVKQEIICS